MRSTLSVKELLLDSFSKVMERRQLSIVGMWCSSLLIALLRLVRLHKADMSEERGEWEERVKYRNVPQTALRWSTSLRAIFFG